MCRQQNKHKGNRKTKKTKELKTRRRVAQKLDHTTEMGAYLGGWDRLRIIISLASYSPHLCVGCLFLALHPLSSFSSACSVVSSVRLPSTTHTHTHISHHLHFSSPHTSHLIVTPPSTTDTLTHLSLTLTSGASRVRACGAASTGSSWAEGHTLTLTSHIISHPHTCGRVCARGRLWVAVAGPGLPL